MIRSLCFTTAPNGLLVMREILSRLLLNTKSLSRTTHRKPTWLVDVSTASACHAAGRYPPAIARRAALLEREDALPVVPHADNYPVLLLRHVVHRLAQGAYLGVGEPLRRAVGVLACCIIVHHQPRQPSAAACFHVLQHLLVVGG